MTTGEGGMVTTNSGGIAGRIRRIINHGQTEKYLHTELGYNMRMTDISAAIGRVQLAKIDIMNNIRQKNAEYYNKNLNLKGIITPFLNPASTHVYHMYTLSIEEDFSMERDGFLMHLNKNGIGASVHYPIPVHRQPIYSGREAECQISEELSKKVISIPVHPSVTREDCIYISDKIREAL